MVKFVVDCRAIKRLDAEKSFARQVEGLKHRMKAFLGTQSTMPPLEQLDSIILSAVAKGNKVVLFIDEVNRLRPELDANGLPKTPQEEALG